MMDKNVTQAGSTTATVDVDVEVGARGTATGDAEWADETSRQQERGNQSLQRSETFAEKLQKKVGGIDAYAFKVRQYFQFPHGSQPIVYGTSNSSPTNSPSLISMPDLYGPYINPKSRYM